MKKKEKGKRKQLLRQERKKEGEEERMGEELEVERKANQRK